YGVTLVGIKSAGRVFTYADPSTLAGIHDLLIVAGHMKLLGRFAGRPSARLLDSAVRIRGRPPVVVAAPRRIRASGHVASVHRPQTEPAPRRTHRLTGRKPAGSVESDPALSGHEKNGVEHEESGRRESNPRRRLGSRSFTIKLRPHVTAVEQLSVQVEPCAD